MRREGLRIPTWGNQKVVKKEIKGAIHEPVELLTVVVPEAFSGKVIEIVNRRKGEMLNMVTKGDRMVLEFNIPARGMIGLTNPVLTATEGEAVVAHRANGYIPWKGEIQRRRAGSLIAMETGCAIPYAIDKLQDRGRFFVEAGDEIYVGQVIGENSRQADIVVNITKTKKLSNVRASGSDNKALLIPPVKFSLEEAMEYIKEDEYIEITPKSMRIRKILLDENDRKRAKNAEQA